MEDISNTKCENWFECEGDGEVDTHQTWHEKKEVKEDPSYDQTSSTEQSASERVFIPDVLMDASSSMEEPYNTELNVKREVTNGWFDPNGKFDGGSEVELVEGFAGGCKVGEMSAICGDSDKGPAGTKHSVEAQFDCSECEKTFPTYAKLYRHLRCHKAKRIQCKHCNKRFLFRTYLQRHMQVHTGIKPFKCSVCSKGLSSSRSLRLHLRTHDKDASYYCEVCGKSYKSLDYYKDHKLEHQGDMAFSCGVCGNSFASSKRLKSHMMGHMDLPCYKCRICSRSFKAWASRRAHELSHFLNRKSRCDICKRLVRNLESHMRVHTSAAPFKCELCGRGFFTERAQHEHYSSVFHTGEKSWTCDICNKSLSTKSSLNKHKLRRHHSEKTFVCKTCNKAYSTQNFLNEHMKTHQEKSRFVCGVCNKEYRSKRCLQDHLDLHRSGRSFNCPECYVMCFTQAQLDNHTCIKSKFKIQKELSSITTGTVGKVETSKPSLSKKSENCTLCAKICRNVLELSVHMRSRHPGQRPFRCDLCNQDFVVEKHLTLHIANKH